MRAVLLMIALGALVGCASTAERQAEDVRKDRLVSTDVQLAAGYLRNGQIEFAKEKLDKALALDPDSSEANNMMALLQWRLKDFDQAQRYFERAVASPTNDPEAQNNFGVFLCERGRIEDAEKWFRRAANNPLYHTPAAANENAGLCYVKKDMPAKAEPFFREALRIEPQRPMSLYQMARISYDGGRTLAARGFLQRYVAVAQDTPQILLLAVRIERALHNKDEEASYALRLRSKFPNSPEAQQLQKSTGVKR